MSLQDVYLLLRYSPGGDNEDGLHLLLTTSYLLSKNLQRLSIQQRMRTRVTVFLSEGFTNDTSKRLKKWFESIYTPYTKIGNQPSWEYMINHTKHNKEIQPDTILFFLEDDYIYEATMLSDTIEFFASYNPCFFHQTDYPDRYYMDINDDDGKITIVAGKTRLWRSITSTTVTYACRWRTFLAFEDIIMQPKNDWIYANELVIWCFSPPFHRMGLVQKHSFCLMNLNRCPKLLLQHTIRTGGYSPVMRCLKRRKKKHFQLIN
jgi:hypothetical protein